MPGPDGAGSLSSYANQGTVSLPCLVLYDIAMLMKPGHAVRRAAEQMAVLAIRVGHHQEDADAWLRDGY
jgi:hypothetical protein